MFTPTTLPRLTDEETERAMRHPDWKKYRGECPTCGNTGSFRYLGEEYDCPTDDYGHVRTRLFLTYLAANIPEQYQVLIWDEYPHPAVKSAVESYLDNFSNFYSHGMGMELLSKQQAVGKTWAATHILREVVKQGYKGWFVDFVEVKDYHELADHDERVWKTRMLRETPVLVLDDIRRPVSPAQTSFFEDKLEGIIRDRTNGNLITILTSNMEEEELEERFPRVFSLLQAKTLDRLHIRGDDARHGVVYEDNKDLAMNGERRPVT